MLAIADLLSRLRGGRRPRDCDDDRLGTAGERLAARFLRRAGYRVLGRNLRVPMGEADLLCEAPDRVTIVLVEVKTRRTAAPGGPGHPAPEASVHADKRSKLLSILRHLARANGWTTRPLRIDVVAIDWPASGEPTVRHLVNAVVARR